MPSTSMKIPFLLEIFLLVMVLQCLGCPRNFSDRRALKTHQRNCQAYKNIQDVTFQQKRAREEQEEVESRPRKKTQALIDPGDFTAVVSVIEYAHTHHKLNDLDTS